MDDQLSDNESENDEPSETELQDGQIITEWPNGKHRIVYPNGQTVTTLPDGRQIWTDGPDI